MPLTPGTRIGVYEVTAQIGVGGMGVGEADVGGRDLGGGRPHVCGAHRLVRHELDPGLRRCAGWPFFVLQSAVATALAATKEISVVLNWSPAFSDEGPVRLSSAA